MSTLVDTNIVTRSAQPCHAMYQAAVDAVDLLTRQGETLCLVPQNIYEFWVVATRPAALNGLGLGVAEAQTELARLKRIFTLVHDTPLILTQWELLINQYQVVGKNAHDSRLVAAMKVHGINQFLTFNTQDFTRYQGITVLSPFDVLQAPQSPSQVP
jgi:predicted nucleic acid-binding protein